MPNWSTHDHYKLSCTPSITNDALIYVLSQYKRVSCFAIGNKTIISCVVISEASSTNTLIYLSFFAFCIINCSYVNTCIFLLRSINRFWMLVLARFVAVITTSYRGIVILTIVSVLPAPGGPLKSSAFSNDLTKQS